MSTTYRFNGISKSVELDDYEQGCIGGGPGDSWIAMPGERHDSADAAVDAFCAFLGAPGSDDDAVSLNACEETGRIDYCCGENADGNTPTDDERDAWKLGECELFYVTYSADIERVTSVAADLE